MKKVFLGAIAVLLFTSSVSFGQINFSPSLKREYFVSLGLSAPTRPTNFSDQWKAGFNIGGGISFELTDVLALATTVEYTRFPFDVDQFNKTIGVAGIQLLENPAWNTVTYTSNLKLVFPSPENKVTPYLIGGIGLYTDFIGKSAFIDNNGVTISSPSESASAFAASFGAGIEIPLKDNWGIFIEGGFMSGLTENQTTQFFPFKVGLMRF